MRWACLLTLIFGLAVGGGAQPGAGLQPISGIEITGTIQVGGMLGAALSVPPFSPPKRSYAHSDPAHAANREMWSELHFHNWYFDNVVILKIEKSPMRWVYAWWRGGAAGGDYPLQMWTSHPNNLVVIPSMERFPFNLCQLDPYLFLARSAEQAASFPAGVSTKTLPDGITSVRVRYPFEAGEYLEELTHELHYTAGNVTSGTLFTRLERPRRQEPMVFYEFRYGGLATHGYPTTVSQRVNLRHQSGQFEVLSVSGLPSHVTPTSVLENATNGLQRQFRQRAYTSGAEDLGITSRTVTLLTGETIPLSEWCADKWTLLHFWATWAPDMPADFSAAKLSVLGRVQELYQQLGNRPDFQVIGVTVDADADRARAFAAAHGMVWPQIILSPENREVISSGLGAATLPHVALVDPRGGIDYGSGEIDRLLGREAEDPVTRPYVSSTPVESMIPGEIDRWNQAVQAGGTIRRDLGPTAVRLMLGSAQLEAFRGHFYMGPRVPPPAPGQPRPTPIPTPKGLQVIERVAIDKAFGKLPMATARRVAEWLLDDTNFDNNTCECYEPDFVLRFRDPEATITVTLNGTTEMRAHVEELGAGGSGYAAGGITEQGAARLKAILPQVFAK